MKQVGVEYAAALARAFARPTPCRTLQSVMVSRQEFFRKIRTLTPLTPNIVELMPTLGDLSPPRRARLGPGPHANPPTGGCGVRSGARESIRAPPSRGEIHHHS